MLLRAAGLAFLTMLPLTAAAQTQRVYAGEEAAALRCSNTVALTAVALYEAEMIGEAQKEIMLGVTLLILERHVSGSWRQKKAALAIMRDRRSIEDTLEDYRRNAARCLTQFPIN
ncbi:hypothetical protein ACFSUD_05140 [Sulfitobacter aestuarii]|uniref:Uncharacterized protein n=1 Tax=Sulfitobacter aestuarii TaxID=2161676 RepID=A0ABW5TZ63_9RHOB